MGEPLHPLDALESTIEATIICDFHRRYPKPGGIVKRMGKSTREALSRLTSDQALTSRFEPWMVMDREWEARQKFRQMLLDFDHQQLGL